MKFFIVLAVTIISGSMLQAQEYWSPRFAPMGCAAVMALGVDQNQNVYLGGGFSSAFGTNAKYFAKWNAQKGWDSVPGQFAGGTYPVQSIAVGASNEVYVFGGFQSVGSLKTRIVAKWNGTQWDSVPGSYVFGASAYNVRLYFFGGNLYAVGQIPGGIRQFTGTSWQTVGAGLGTVNGNSSGYSHALAVDKNGTLHAATFNAAKTSIAIVKWNGTSWDTVASGITGTTAFHVNDIAFSGDTMYVAGLFLKAGTKSVNNIARWNGSKWDSLGVGSNYEQVSIEADSKGRLYCAGSMAPANGTIGWGGITRWNGTAWEQFGSGITKSVGQYVAINDMKLVNDKLYLAGDFTNPGGLAIQGAVIYDINSGTWQSMPGGNANGLDWYVKAVHVDKKGTAYIGGAFTFAGAVPVYGVARWNGSRWDSIGMGVRSGSVKAILSDDTVTYFAGSFSNLGNVPSLGVVKWNGQRLVSMNGTGQPGVYTTDIRALAYYGSSMIAAGSFTSAFGTRSISSILKWTGTRWDTLDAGIVGAINALAVKGTDLYAAGSFSVAGNSSAKNIARWDGTKWNALGNGLSGNGGTVYDMAFAGNDLIVVGLFDSAGTKKSPRLAKWNGTSWDTVSTAVPSGGYGSYFNNVAVDAQGRIYVSGLFGSINGNTALRSLARLSNGKWEAVAGGVNGTPYNDNEAGLLETDRDGNIWYSNGSLTQAGSVPSYGLAKLVISPSGFDAVKKVDAAVPAQYALDQNFPNPFNPSTTIQFAVTKNDNISLKIYDVLGREVATLVSQRLEPGKYSVQWNAQHNSSGVYFYSLHAGNSVVTRRMLLLK